jgi:hypothetical protein
MTLCNSKAEHLQLLFLVSWNSALILAGRETSLVSWGVICGEEVANNTQDKSQLQLSDLGVRPPRTFQLSLMELNNK